MESPPERSFALRISFGHSDVTSERWEGSFQVEKVRIEEARGWELQSVDQISLSSFELYTLHPSRQVAVPKGIVVRGIALPAARFQVDTNQGSFSFPIADLEGGRLLEFLDGKAQVRGLLDVTRLTEDSQEDDYPTIAVSGDQAWAAWQSFHGESDEIRVAGRDTDLSGSGADHWNQLLLRPHGSGGSSGGLGKSDLGQPVALRGEFRVPGSGF